MAGTAGIVLAGGRSSRMGSSKAALEWHGSTLLRRVTGVVARSVDGPVIVAKAPDQEIPAVPSCVEVHEDPREGLGPMQGLATGLAAVAERADAAFVCSTDLPFLHTAYVRAVMAEIDLPTEEEPVEVVLPLVNGFPQPMAAGYRTSVLSKVVRLLSEERLRPAFLFDECRVARIQGDDLLRNRALAAADPQLDSVVNVNLPVEYASARARPAPEVTVQALGVLAANGRAGPLRIRAATLAGAAAEMHLALDRHVVAALNGYQIERDLEFPLETGDTVSFMSAEAGG